MPRADLILSNAKILTLDPVYPQATMVAIKDGKVMAISGDEDFDILKGDDTDVIDCGGRTVLPGFHDAHCHIFGFAESLLSPNLNKTAVRSIAEIQNKIREVSMNLPSGSWIRARGYNRFYLDEKRHPTRWDLDKATTTHPVKLTHRTGYAHVLNSLALSLAGISSDTPEPPGAIIERDLETGEPNGVLYGMDSYLADVIPPLGDGDLERGITLANERLLSLGVTSIQDASVRNGIQRWQMFQKWKERGLFTPRVSMMVGEEAFSRYQGLGLFSGTGDDRLHLGGVKMILHETTGRLTPVQEELNRKVLRIHQSGLQVAMHAMEEATLEAACLALENALRSFPRKDHRHRIEHCSVCTVGMAKRLASLQAVVVTQPAFIYYNGERYLKTVPRDQLKNLYPIARLIKSGLKVAASSDCPVVPPNPLIGVYAAASRLAETGQSVLLRERISTLEALRMYADVAAYSCFEEDKKGTLVPGKFADLVVLSDDPTGIALEDLKELDVAMTVIDGDIVWRRDL